MNRKVFAGILMLGSVAAGCSQSDSKNNESSDKDDASVVAAIVAAQLEAQKEAERLEAERQDSIRQDSIERHKLVDFGVKDFLKRKGDDVEMINWESRLAALGFKKGTRKKLAKFYAESEEWVDMYQTVYTCECKAGKIVIEYDYTRYDFSWKIRFDNPEQKEKFIQSLYAIGYNKATEDRDDNNQVYKFFSHIGNNIYASIYWIIYADYIEGGLSSWESP